MDPVESAKAQAAMVRSLCDSMARKIELNEITSAGGALQFVQTWTEAVEMAVENLVAYQQTKIH